MLGKQWLNRYASTDMRGTAIERSQNRQRKLDGVIAWYFDHVMESLPLMLQAALFLLGCALSRYLWEIDVTIASVVLGVTSFGIIFYISIVVAGTASESCPYQTPCARICRHIIRHIIRPVIRHIIHLIPVFFSKSSSFIRNTRTRSVVFEWWLITRPRPWYSTITITMSIFTLLAVPIALLADVCIVGLVVVMLLGLRLVACYRTAYHCIFNTRFHQTHRLDQETTMLDKETIMLDLRCITWMIQTSLDKVVHLSALKHLATMTTLADFDQTLVTDCLDAFIGCIKMGADDHEVIIVQGFEQLATASALCFFNTISHLLVMDPTSNALEDVRQRYIKVFSVGVDFHGHQFYHAMNSARRIFAHHWERRFFQWSNYKPSTHEHTIVAHNLVKVTRFKYQRPHKEVKVPRWILRFILHSLSLDPLPPVSVVADCLLIIAIDLGCELPNAGTVIPDERYACV